MEFIQIIIFSSIYLGLVATTFFVLSYLSCSKKEKLLFSDDELPFVSILIPVWNEEKSIAKTLNSILKTDYPKDKFEIIVINDGSIDKTLELARKYEFKGVKVFSKENGGKGSALNFGIKRARGQIIFSMDADTLVDKKSVKNMVRYFKNKQIMCVSPAIAIYNPKGILQRVQHIEYLSGLFLRKAFASLNAIHVTPGAFSAYRKSFFDKYRGYDEKNLTEDLELALRIQSKGYLIENSLESPVYTIAPNKFLPLLKQRRRWYIGLMKNTWNYKKIFGKKYGDLGMFVLPNAWLAVLLSMFVFVFMSIKTLLKVKDELLFFNSINFDFGSLGSLSLYTLERYAFLLFTNPIVIFLLIFTFLIGFYLYFATKRTSKVSNLSINLPLFLAFFSILFGFWWTVSLIYFLFNRDISWR